MKRLLVILCIICTLLLCACSKEDIKEEIKEIVPDVITTTAIPTATVTFPEGFTAVQIAERLEENSVCSAADFLKLVNDKEFINSLGYTFASFVPDSDRAFILEGYVFPDTYEFYLNDSAENVLRKILVNTAAKLTGAYTVRAEELGYTLDEIVTLASIIQEEAYTDESMKLISSVLHNRLKSPDFPKLQCDVTVHYLNDYVIGSPYLTVDTEKYKELYNAYKCVGLPEGPICCPGIEAIEAALYPEESDYYYFFTDKDWNYYFNETYSAHVKQARELDVID